MSHAYNLFDRSLVPGISLCRIPHQLQPGRCVDVAACPAYLQLVLPPRRPDAADAEASATHAESKRRFMQSVRCHSSSSGSSRHPSDGRAPEPVRVCCPFGGVAYREPYVPRRPSGNEADGTTAATDGAKLLPSWSECGLQYENRIFGGDLLDLDEFPWMALLIYSAHPTRRPVFGCGGVLISRRYVLTAAHCVSGELYNRL